MKVSGFTLIRNGEKLDFPYLESIRSLLPVVDELIVNVGTGEDQTSKKLEELKKEFPEKLILFESNWPLDDPEEKRGGKILSDQTNLALERCTGDWCVYLQGDEVLHQFDYRKLYQCFQQYLFDDSVEALVFDYLHFYGAYNVVQKTRSAYRREIRAFKRDSSAVSVGDAQSFRTIDGRKLKAALSGVRVFHYGWVRPPEIMREKTFFMDQLYHAEKPSADGTPHSGDNYKYKKFWGLKAYHGSHPAVMEDRLAKKGWSWDLRESPLAFSLRKDLKKIVLDTFEGLTGVRLFEYRAYQLVDSPRAIPLSKEIEKRFPPSASVIVATYNMPRHLELVLAGLTRQTTSNFEVIIADDGSDENTKAVVDRYRRVLSVEIQHLWQEDRGFRKCKILNNAVRAAKGEVLIFLDGDCIPHSYFVEDHLAHQEKGRYLAGRRVELGQSFSEWLTPEKVLSGYFDRPGINFILSAIFGDTEHLQRSVRISSEGLRHLLGMNRIDDMKGCNYSVAKADLISVNGFDETYEGYGREDTDAEQRFKNFGLEIKSLKGVALQFHVWHPRKKFTPLNEDLLAEVKSSGRYIAQKGLSM